MPKHTAHTHYITIPVDDYPAFGDQSLAHFQVTLMHEDNADVQLFGVEAPQGNISWLRPNFSTVEQNVLEGRAIQEAEYQDIWEQDRERDWDVVRDERDGF